MFWLHKYNIFTDRPPLTKRMVGHSTVITPIEDNQEKCLHWRTIQGHCGGRTLQESEMVFTLGQLLPYHNNKTTASNFPSEPIIPWSRDKWDKSIDWEYLIMVHEQSRKAKKRCNFKSYIFTKQFIYFQVVVTRILLNNILIFIIYIYWYT